MRARAALLTMTAALVMITGLTGCGAGSKNSTKSVRPHHYGQNGGIKPLHTNNLYHTNRYNPNGYGYGPHFYHMDGYGYGIHGYPNGYNYGGYNYGGYNYDGRYHYNVTDMNGRHYGTHYAENMHISKKISDKLVSIKGIKSAYVMLTNNNAYIAVATDHMTTDHPHMISSDLKEKIYEVVKKEVPEHTTIYISTDPHFVERMKVYYNHSMSGHPLSGLLTEFQQMVYDMFPTNVVVRPYSTHHHHPINHKVPRK